MRQFWRYGALLGAVALGATTLTAQDTPPRGQVPSTELQKAIDANELAVAYPLAKAEMAACEAALAQDASLGLPHCFFIRQETLHLAVSMDDNAFAIAEGERLLTDAQGDSILHLEARLTAINILSVAYGDVGNFEKAAAFLQMDLDESLKLFGPNSEEVAISYLNLGVFFDYKLRQHSKGLGYYQQAEAALRAGGLEGSTSMPIALAHQGRAYDNMGLPYQSADLYRRAIAMGDALPPEERGNQAIRRQNFASVLNQIGHVDEAQGQLRMAIVDLERTYGADSTRVAWARLSMAVGLHSQGRYSDAKDILDALWTHGQAKQDVTLLAYVSLWQARLEVARGNFAVAERHLDDNAKLMAQWPIDPSGMRVQAGMERIEIAYLRRDYLEMGRQLDAVLALPESSFGDSDWVALRQWQGEHALAVGEAAKALAFLRDARARAEKTMPLGASIFTILDGKIAYILSLENPNSPEAKGMMDDVGTRAAQSGLSGTFAIARHQGPVSGYRELHLDHLDMIRRAGGDVAAAMAPAQSLFSSGAAAAAARLQRLSAQDNASLAKLVRDRDVTREKLRWMDRKAEAGRGAEALSLAQEDKRLTAEIAAIDPNFDARGGDTPVSLAAMQARLEAGEVLLITIEDARRGLHIWAITSGSAQWHFVADQDLQTLRPQLAALHNAYGATMGAMRGQERTGESGGDIDGFAASQSQVSDMLLRPVAKVLRGARHIHVLTTGIVGTIPVASLPFDGGYLADVAAVSRYTSMASFAEARGHRRGVTKPLSAMQVLAIAPDYAAIDGYTALPFAREQMAVLSDLGFAGLHQMAGQNANEHAVKKAAALTNADLILFASHSVYVEGQGPAFLLHSGDGEDGRLTSDEIALLSTRAELVLLTACTTAAAAPDEPDALSGMARGFLLSGSRGIVISHWPIEDKAASLMGSMMLSYLAKNPDATRADALRHAALGLRAMGGRYAHPRYWAAFSVVEE